MSEWTALVMITVRLVDPIDRCTLLSKEDDYIEFRTMPGRFMVGQAGEMQVRLRLGSNYEEILTLKNVSISLKPDGEHVIVRAKYLHHESEVVKVISSSISAE